jgi:hypothetical protein
LEQPIPGTALRDGPGKEIIVIAAIGKELGANRLSAGALALDSDTRRIASEGGDILLDPRERQTHISQAQVGVECVLDFLAIHETPGPEAGIHPDVNARAADIC